MSTDNQEDDDLMITARVAAIFLYLALRAGLAYAFWQNGAAALRQTLTVTAGSNQVGLTFGFSDSASDAYDRAIDLPAPPAAPVPAFEARLFNPAGGLIKSYYTDMRAPNNEQQFILRLRGNRDGESVVITWPGLQEPPAVLTLRLDDETFDLSDAGSVSMQLPDTSFTEGMIELMRSATGVASSAEAALPAEFRLGQSYPNPANPQTTIEYAVARTSDSAVLVQFRLYNIQGQLVRTLVDAHKLPGDYEVTWDGRNDSGVQLASGIYLYVMTAGPFEMCKKVVLVR